MNCTQKLIFLLTALFFIGELQAETLLIPDQMVTAEYYFEKCQLEGYICAQNFQVKSLQEKPTPLFDAFVDSIDLSSKNFLEKIPKQIQQILKTEMISVQQLNMLLHLLEQTDATENQLLLKEMKTIYNLIAGEKKISLMTENFILFFKEPMAKSRLEKMNARLIGVPYYEINYNRLALLKSTQSADDSLPGYLAAGECDQWTTVLPIESVKWKVLSEKSCGWGKEFQNSSQQIYTTVIKNKNWFLTGALIIGAVALASHHEVVVEF